MDMKNNVKRMFIMMLACVLVFSSVSVNNSIRAEAAAKVTKIKLSKKNLTINAGSSKKLAVSISPTKAKKRKVTWTSSNKKVATVKDGKVTGVSAGKATITVKCDGKRFSCRVTVTWSSKAKKALKSYKSYLEQDYIPWSNAAEDMHPNNEYRFALADMNADGVPELMLRPSGFLPSHAAGYEAVYCYAAGKVKEMARMDEIRRYYPKKGVVVLYHGGMGSPEYYYKLLNSGNVKELGYGYTDVGYGTLFFGWEGEVVTKSQFKKLLKKNVGNESVNIKESDWHENTDSNRKKMAKLIKK